MPDSIQYLKTIQVGQADVEKYQIRSFILCNFQARLARLRLKDFIAFISQEKRKGLKCGALILDD
jgi:hypothetical protein